MFPTNDREKDNETIALIGVENWGAKGNFSKYGDLKKAYTGSEGHSFKLLMSHDPSHWEAEVCKSFNDIDLMLSGHTHGMQFGIEIPGYFKWKFEPLPEDVNAIRYSMPSKVSYGPVQFRLFKMAGIPAPGEAAPLSGRCFADVFYMVVDPSE